MEDFSQLLEKFIAETLTPAELPEFLSRAGEPVNQPLVQQALARKMESDHFVDLSHGADLETLFTQVLGRAALQEQAHPEKQAGSEKRPELEIPDNPFRRSWFRYAAAAIILFLAAGSVLLIVRKSQKNDITARPVNSDVSPGGNKAILTLANGEKVTLDSAANGILSQQGSATVSKTGNGQLAYNLSPEKPTRILYNTLMTPRGGQYQLTLPDGTKVWLDAASSIRYPTAFTGKTRKVEVSGQVYFEVVHNDRLPFEVSAGGLEIIDIGTHFNINTYPDEPLNKITLLEGAVAVTANTTRLELKPGEQVQSADGGLHFAGKVDINAVMAWKNGEFQLSHIDFGTLMRQISRWYDIDIVYEGKVPDKKFWGTMNRNVNLSRLLEVLHDYGIGTTLQGKKLTIMK